MPEFIKIYYLQSDKLGWLVNDLLFSIGIAVLFGSGNQKAKKFPKKVFLSAFAAWGLIIFGESVLYTLFSDAYTKQIVYPFVILTFIIFSYILTKKTNQLIRNILNGITFYAMGICCINVSAMAAIEFGDGVRYASVWLSLIMVPLLVTFLMRFSLTEISVLPNYFNALVIEIGSVSILLEYLVEKVAVYNHMEFTYAILIDLCMLLIELGAYCTFHHYGKTYEQMNYAIAATLRAEAEQSAYELNQKNIEELRKFRHDSKNQMLYVKKLLDQKQYDELRDYFTRETDSFHQIVDYVDCGNRVISNIMNLAIAKADVKNCQISYQILVPPELPRVSENDLCSLILNLIDNAAEACERMNVQGETIHVIIRLQARYLVICVENPYEADGKPDYMNLKTSKKQSGHGYGTKIIQNIIEKYHGISDFSGDNGIFRAEIMLDTEA